MPDQLIPAPCRQPARTLRATWHRLAAVFAGLAALPGTALADLPTVQPPSSGGGGSLYDTLQGYVADGILLLALLVTAAVFVLVAGSAMSKFRDATRKGEWGEFAVVIVVGVVLIVATIWLGNKAITVL